MRGQSGRGIFRGVRNAAGQWSWSPFNDGMPQGAIVTKLRVNAFGTIYAATWGRGAFAPLPREWGSDTSHYNSGLPSALAGSSSRRGAAEAPHFRSAHSPSRPDTLAQDGSSTAKAFLRALAVAFHRSPTSLRWCWTGERQIAVVVSCTHHRDRRTFPRRIPPGSCGRVAGA